MTLIFIGETANGWTRFNNLSVHAYSREESNEEEEAEDEEAQIYCIIMNRFEVTH